MFGPLVLTHNFLRAFSIFKLFVFSFFDNAARIGSADYVPTQTDILRARIKTTGISENRFTMGNLSLCMIDVGGQISERKKWIHTFENVTSIIFCMSLAEYDQVLLEDPTQSRLLDSLLLFESIVNSQWFRHTSIILFLNKTDLFKKRLAVSSLASFFDDYRSPNAGLVPSPSLKEPQRRSLNDLKSPTSVSSSAAASVSPGTFDLQLEYEHASHFIKSKFLTLNHNRLPIYPHFTCATDTQQIETVFAASKKQYCRTS